MKVKFTSDQELYQWSYTKGVNPKRGEKQASSLRTGSSTCAGNAFFEDLNTDT